MIETGSVQLVRFFQEGRWRSTRSVTVDNFALQEAWTVNAGYCYRKPMSRSGFKLLPSTLTTKPSRLLLYLKVKYLSTDGYCYHFREWIPFKRIFCFVFVSSCLACCFRFSFRDPVLWPRMHTGDLWPVSCSLMQYDSVRYHAGLSHSIPSILGA